MEGCICGWETGEAAAGIHRVMWLTGRRREEGESTMTSQSTLEKSEDLSSGWDPVMVRGSVGRPEGGAQQAAGAQERNLGWR